MRSQWTRAIVSVTCMRQEAVAVRDRQEGASSIASSGTRVNLSVDFNFMEEEIVIPSA